MESIGRGIICRCGSFHCFLSVSVRMLSHSKSDGKNRFSGLEFQATEVSTSFSSARPDGFRVVCE